MDMVRLSTATRQRHDDEDFSTMENSVHSFVFFLKRTICIKAGMTRGQIELHFLGGLGSMKERRSLMSMAEMCE